MSSLSHRFFSPKDISDSIESMESIHGRDKHLIYWLFLLCVTTAIAAIFLIKVDVTVSGVGQIRPAIERLQVISTVSGYIKELNVVDNQHVYEGQSLLTFESDSLNAQIEFCNQERSENEKLCHDLNLLVDHVSDFFRALEEIGLEDASSENLVLNIPYAQQLATPRMLKENATFMGSVERMLIDFQKTEHDFQRIARLKEKDFVSAQDYENKRHETEMALRLLKNAVLQKVNEWQAELQERVLKNSSLQSQQKQLLEQTHLYELKSPSDGTVIGFRGLQKGLLVPQGQTLGEISPSSELLAEVYLSPKDVGFVTEGQHTKVLVDAFPHTEWGMLSGKVREISSDFIQVGDAIAFRTVVELEKLTLHSRKGVTVDVTRGMTVNSRFLIRKRTLFNILFSKMSDAFDPRGND